ncbi:MAG TPA: helix-turn-helix transcriptional regulator [Microbacteriaceae bacterium]|nr:helix-turn-helix transcriptional regulator [Microbacteriaceae bacterium]
MREAILGTLLLGPQYGLQLRSEIIKRTGGVLRINSGQIYQTLERLLRDGLVHISDTTPDGLPLYELTKQGTDVALKWATTPATATRKHPWEAMVIQVLIVRSLPQQDEARLLEAYIMFWQENIVQDGTAEVDPTILLSQTASNAQARAAMEWLAEVRKFDESKIGLSTIRPMRGRPKL